MDNLLKEYTADVDFLLTDVCMTAAMHGLDVTVTAIAEHLREISKTEAAAVLAQSLAKIATRDFDSAVAYADEVLTNSGASQLHPQAAALRRLATELAAGVQPQPLNIDA
jgi:hypothetical protein